MIRDVEIRHAKIFKELYSQMKNKNLYKKAKEVEWIYPACGYVSFDKKLGTSARCVKLNRDTARLICQKIYNFKQKEAKKRLITKNYAFFY